MTHGIWSKSRSYGFAVGFVLGYTVAWIYNWLIGLRGAGASAPR